MIPNIGLLLFFSIILGSPLKPSIFWFMLVLFSIDKNKVYDIIPGQNAIGCYPNFGPVFFGCQIRIYDNYLAKGGTTYKKGLNYCTTEDFELTGGRQNFGVKDIEVYEVESRL